MKELSIEEKAKAYDEALKVLHKYDGINIMFTQDLKEEMFPELREEYEDEKTKKELLAVINDLVLPDEQQSRFIAWIEKQDEHKKFRDSIQVGDKVTRNQDGMLVNLSQLKRIAKPAENKGKNNMGISEATKKKLEDNLNKALEKETPESCNKFLEKQGEQKSANWTKEDENMCNDTINFIETGWTDNGKSHLIPWLKSLKDKVQLQTKYEWSREDEMFLSYIIKDLVHPWNEYIPDRIEYEIKWLKNRFKSLKSQKQWKPSDAQMASVTCAVRKMKESACYDSELVSLFNDLKKLRNE